MDSPLRWVYEKAVGAHASIARPIPSGHALPPIQLFVEVTDRCNLRCRMCFYQGKLHPVDRPEPPAPGLLAPSEILAAARSLPTARLVSLSGGEPFARSDLLEILGGLSAIRKVHLETNATLAGPEEIRALARLGARSIASAGLVSVDVSIHGDEATHDAITGVAGSYRTSLAAVRALVEGRRSTGRPFPKVNLKTTIVRENLGSFPKAADAGRDLGADFVIFKIEDPGKVSFDLEDGAAPLARETFRPFDPDEIRALGASLQTLDRFPRPNGSGGPSVFFLPFGLPMDEVRRHYAGSTDLSRYDCRHPWSRIGVMPRGGIYVCKALGLGNVRTQSLARAWNSEGLRAFRRRLRDEGPIAACAGCCFLEYGRKGR